MPRRDDQVEEVFMEQQSPSFLTIPSEPAQHISPRDDWPTWLSFYPEMTPQSSLCASVPIWGSPYSVLMTLKLPRNIPFCLCWELHCLWIVKYLWTCKQRPHYVWGLWPPAGGGGRAPSKLATGWGHKAFLRKAGDWCCGETICIIYASGTEKCWRNVYCLNIAKDSCWFLPICCVFLKCLPFRSLFCYSIKEWFN